MHRQATKLNEISLATEGLAVNIYKGNQSSLVHPLAAVRSATQTWDLVLVVFHIEFVIVGQLFSPCDASVGDDEDLVLAVDLYNLCHAVGVARVVHVAGQAATEGRIDDSVLF